jgi:hypothetical protein
VLTGIYRDEIELWGSNALTLTFQPSEETDSACKRIPQGGKERLDVLFIRSRNGIVNRIHPARKNEDVNSFPERQESIVFSKHDTYTLIGHIQARDMKVIPWKAEFFYAGDSSFMKLISD